MKQLLQIKLNWVLSLAIVCSPILLLAQATELVEWKQKYKTSASWKGENNLLFHTDSTLYLFFPRKKKKSKIVAYQLYDKPSYEEEVDFNFPEKDIYCSSFIKFDKHTSVIFNKIDKKNNKFRVYNSTFGANKFSPLELIYEHDFDINGKKEFYARNAYDIDSKFAFSPNDEFIVFFNQKHLNSKSNDEAIQIAVFDKSLKLIWDKSVNIPIKDKHIFCQNFCVSNDGKNVVFTAKTKDAYKVVHLTAETDKSYELKLKEAFQANFVLPYFGDQEQSIILAGIIGLPKKGLKKEKPNLGVFNCKMNISTGAYTDFNYHFFNSEEIKNEMNNFKAVTLTRLSNGNYHFLIDSKFTNTKEVYPSFNHPRYNQQYLGYEFRQIVVTCYSPEFELIDQVILDRKISCTENRNGLDYCYKNDDLYLVYDTRRSKRDKEKFNIKGPNSMKITKLIHIDENGALKSESLLLDSKESKSYLDDIITLEISNQLLFGGKIQKNIQGPAAIHGKKNYQFGLVDLLKIE